MKKQENILGYEKIGKLMIKFSIPCIISMVVNSLYNIVDQIFIGWGVGYLGNGATNVVFPLVMICLSFALMFGDGSSAFLSLKLGEKKKEEASRGVANGILLSVIVSIILCLISLIFLPQLLNLFGCTKVLKNYALSYGYVISIGIPFMIVGTTLNSIIRADGNPKYAMTSMVSGAILNIILDPIFIFIFHMGVQGAAIATIISQILTFAINIMYIKKFKSIKLDKNKFKLNINLSKSVSMLGISSFITQMSIVFVMSVENNLLSMYGSGSKYGSEIPITVLGIVMKINQILNSIIIGIAAGSQPIVGYNYGSENYDRVKETLKKVLFISVIVSTIAFITFQTIPDKLISIFGSGNKTYIEFACIAFRTYLMLCICNGIQIPSGIFFQAIGKSSKSAFLSLSRQILFLIPAMFILGKLFGINGLLYAGPFADGLAFIIAVILLTIEVKNLGKSKIVSNSLVDDTSSDNKLKNHVVITISREYGSGGRYIGRLVADKLGIKLYDKDFIVKLAEKTGLSEEYIEGNEQRKDNLINLNNIYYYGMDNADTLFIEESKLIKEVAKRESCVIIGRCADFILKDDKDTVKIFIYSSMDDKVNRAVNYYGMDKKKANKEIKHINKLRSNHYKYYTGSDWKDSTNYDISINSDLFGVEKTADMICDILKNKDLDNE
jgi:putative MATE family efflux protein